MEETKTFVCGKSQEDSWIKTWQNFGWSLLSSQEVHKNDNSFSNASDGSLVVTTTTEDYIKLVFKRDTKMPHYAEITNLERQYNKQIASLESKASAPKFNLFWLILLPIYIIIAVVKSNKNKQIESRNQEIYKKMDSLEYEARDIMLSI